MMLRQKNYLSKSNCCFELSKDISTRESADDLIIDYLKKRFKETSTKI